MLYLLIILIYFSLLVNSQPYGEVEVLMRPKQMDTSSASSESAVLIKLSNYPTPDIKYRLYNGLSQYNCWDPEANVYVSSSSYANGPMPIGDPTTSTTFWIPYQRGSNNSTTANYRDRLGPDYTVNNNTITLPSTFAIQNPIYIDNSFVNFNDWTDYAQKYVVLGFDSLEGGNLITATSTELNTGSFNLVVEKGTVLRKIEVRTLDNVIVSQCTGIWPNDSADILNFIIPGQIYSEVNYNDTTVTVYVPYGMNLTNIVPQIMISKGATIMPSPNDPQDFTNPVQYTVLAHNQINQKVWTVQVVYILNNQAEILSFTIPGQVYSTINSLEASIQVLMPYGTNITNLTPIIEVSYGATIDPPSGVPQDFTNPVYYTVTAQDGITQKVWEAKVIIQPNTEAEILSFYIEGQIHSEIISSTASVNVLMPYGTDITNLTPIIEISEGATITPNSGVPQDFSQPVTYLVTAQDGITQKIWTVNVNVAQPNYVKIVEWTFPNNPDDCFADDGIQENLDKCISSTASGTISFSYAGATTNCARVTGWDDGEYSKYWLITFTTLNYKDIKLSSKQRSSSTGPKDFKVQYSLDNENWYDVPNSEIVCNDDWTTGVLNQLSLPEECNNKFLVSIRWLMTSSIAVNGSLVSASGANRIDDISLIGLEIPSNILVLNDYEDIIIYPNPTMNEFCIKNSKLNVFDIRIYNTQNRLLYITSEKCINLVGFEKGIYVVEFLTENQIIRKKIVKL